MSRAFLVISLLITCPSFGENQAYSTLENQQEASKAAQHFKEEALSYLRESLTGKASGQFSGGFKMQQGRVCKSSGVAGTCTGHAAISAAASEADNLANSSGLLVFVSFSMPELTLRNYSRDVKKVGGRLLVRGLLDDSFKVTQQRLRQLGIELDIDPDLFTKYKVQQVPSFIWLTDGQPSNRLVGHVSLQHVLQEFAGVSQQPELQLALEKLVKPIREDQ
ncbi:MAG: type-F conjugative transfer system pilin assembly protein TrbC [Pseudomonadota bacterium]